MQIATEGQMDRPETQQLLLHSGGVRWSWSTCVKRGM